MDEDFEQYWEQDEWDVINQNEANDYRGDCNEDELEDDFLDDEDL